jgi:hypothetical protein
MSTNMATPAIHQGALPPPIVAAAAARRLGAAAPPPLPAGAFAPHWLQNVAPPVSFAPHLLQNLPPSAAPQCWQKLPAAGFPHWGQFCFAPPPFVSLIGAAR